ncbi:hypothetical protein PROFUN_04356 [Planoprotostelium fungivorum]|uniref:Uncharacterized protein n=1 Tax=Planoprotostelium fungivorum TaxID=1890364 RepID=A0A2P6NHS3_9EUKA|nr:hypothetical protein PROFUN_04356 [Planoprotostelium fungivorum]
MTIDTESSALLSPYPVEDDPLKALKSDSCQTDPHIEETLYEEDEYHTVRLGDEMYGSTLHRIAVFFFLFMGWWLFVFIPICALFRYIERRLPPLWIAILLLLQLGGLLDMSADAFYLIELLIHRTIQYHYTSVALFGISTFISLIAFGLWCALTPKKASSSSRQEYSPLCCFFYGGSDGGGSGGGDAGAGICFVIVICFLAFKFILLLMRAFTVVWTLSIVLLRKGFSKEDILWIQGIGTFMLVDVLTCSLPICVMSVLEWYQGHGVDQNPPGRSDNSVLSDILLCIKPKKEQRRGRSSEKRKGGTHTRVDMSDEEGDEVEKMEEDPKEEKKAPKVTTFPIPKDKPRFEIKKWQAVTLWSWDIDNENCAICKERIQELCIDCQLNSIGESGKDCTVAWGACNVSDSQFCNTTHPIRPHVMDFPEVWTLGPVYLGDKRLLLIFTSLFWSSNSIQCPSMMNHVSTATNHSGTPF